MKKIQDIAGFVFITAVSVLSFVSILGVWEFFGNDVILKSFQTLGLLAIAAIVIIVAGRFVDHKSEDGSEIIFVPNPLFKTIRMATVGVLIVSASLLALLGVLAIWDVISDKDVLFKSLGSLGILTFTSLISVVTCLEREGNKILRRGGGGVLLAQSS